MPSGKCPTIFLPGQHHTLSHFLGPKNNSWCPFLQAPPLMFQGPSDTRDVGHSARIEGVRQDGHSHLLNSSRKPPPARTPGYPGLFQAQKPLPINPKAGAEPSPSTPIRKCGPKVEPPVWLDTKHCKRFSFFLNHPCSQLPNRNRTWW